MGVTVVEHGRFTDDLVHRWQVLADRCGCALFSTPGWCRTWIETVGRDVRPVIVEVRDGDRTVAILPIGIHRRRGCRWCEMLGGARVGGDHLDLICRPAAAGQVTGAILDYLATAPRRFDGWHLANITNRSVFAACLLERCARNRDPWIEHNRLQLPYVPLPASLDAYVRSLSSNMRYHIRRRWRQADQAGAGVRMVRDPVEVGSFLDTFLVLHAARWRSMNKPGAFTDPDKRRFLVEWCHAAALRGWLRGYLLQIEEQAVGALIAFHHRDRACFYQMGWRPNRWVHSPGVVLLTASIRQAIGEQLAVYDFLQGDEHYKSRWTRSAAHQRTVVIGQSLSAKVVVMAMRLKQACTSVMVHRHSPHDRHPPVPSTPPVPPKPSLPPVPSVPSVASLTAQSEPLP